MFVELQVERVGHFEAHSLQIAATVASKIKHGRVEIRRHDLDVVREAFAKKLRRNSSPTGDFDDETACGHARGDAARGGPHRV